MSLEGRSHDSEYWKKKVADWKLAHLTNLDKDFCMDEVLDAARHLQDHKAPGEDGIVGEWMKAVLYMKKEPGEKEGKPSAMARVLLGLFNDIWRMGYIPSCWRRATVVSIHKKGDPTEMDNYRGISLMPVPLKLLLIILTYRLVRELEKKGLLAREQAGFREREECAGQVAALVETILRRSGGGEATFAMFVDLTKAYDVVPHEALFAKMLQLGIRGRMLGFIRNLYYQSEIVVGMGGDQKPFRLKRGLRQGCPMSPILFDIFINDLYGKPGVKRVNLGVTVPGVEVEEEGLLSGLLFADDLVGLASSLKSMREHAQHVDEWCRAWDMKVGIKKCGIMCMGDKKIQTVADDGQEQLREEGAPCLGGDPVPIVEEYVYLGVAITRYLDQGIMAEKRLDKARKAAFLLKPLLRDKHIPVGVRATVLRAVVSASLLYGSELWGMNAERCEKGQVVLNDAMRMMLGSKAKATNIPVVAMWRELGVPPVRAEAAARRARAWFKFPSLKTWIGVLCANEMPSKSNKLKVQTWMMMTSKWLKQNKVQEADGGDGEEKREERTFKKVLEAEWAKAERRQGAKASAEYLRNGYAFTSMSSMVAIPPLGRREQVKLGSGLRLLSLCRIGGLWTAPSIARAYKELEDFKELCPCCTAWVMGRGEDVNHIIVECKRWEKERELYLGRFIRRVKERYGPDVGSDQLGVFLLGGVVEGERLADWLPPRKGKGLPQWSREEILHCGALEMARFLQSIECERKRIVGDLHSRLDLFSGAEALLGMAAMWAQAS
jgi:hypothetical protein